MISNKNNICIKKDEGKTINKVILAIIIVSAIFIILFIFLLFRKIYKSKNNKNLIEDIHNELIENKEIVKN